MKNVAAIIVTYNNQDTIEACIASLRSFGVSNVCIVDNSSIDETVARAASIVARAASIDARVVVSNENKGFGAGVNIGARQVGRDAEYLFCMSPDGQLLGTLSSVIDRLKQAEKLGVVGLRLEDSQGAAEKDSFGKEPTMRQLFLRKMRASQDGSHWQSVDWVSGGAMIIKKKIFFEVGGFDEGFFLYWEDVDLCRRVRDMGYGVQFCPTVGVRHLRGHSLADKQEKTRIFDSSADRYFQKHYAAPIWIFQRFSRFLYRLVSPQVR